MRIDVHCHGWTPQYFDYLKANEINPGAFVDAMAAMGATLDDPGLAERFRLMDAAGVDLQVLSPAGLLSYLDDQGAAVKFAQFANDDYAQVVADHPDRLAAFATLPLPHIDASLNEIARALDDLKFAGIGLHTSVGDLSPVDEYFDPIWEELDRRGAAVFFHPAGNATQSALINKYRLTWLLGAPIEDTFLVTHILKRAIPLRYPHVKLIVAHLGGALPMLIGRFNDQPSVRDRFENSESPGQMAKRIYYDTVGHRHVDGLRNAIASFGAERIVLGTDYPWQLGDRYVDGVKYVEAAGLDDGIAELILDHTLDDVLPALVA